jgi:zinc protease
MKFMGSASRAAASLVDIDYYRLANGLRVVLAECHTAPHVSVGVHYKIGFRLEPRGRTGFAHLFEHLMFQGSSANLPRGEFFKLVQAMGGELNASTRFDHTSYRETTPSNALEAILWAEADRMANLQINEENLQNQKGVVAEEVKGSVSNEPYGGFPWLQLPQYANENWHNAHNFYGDLRDIEAATVVAARKFRDDYYTPNNAVLVVLGDFEPESAKAWIAKYFQAIRSHPASAAPDTSEPDQHAEKQAQYTDALAPQPAFAFAYHLPARWTPEYFAFGLIDEIMLQGTDSRLHSQLVHAHGLTACITGGINPLGTMFDYDGPMLWMASFVHDVATSRNHIRQLIDGVVEQLRTAPLSPEELARAQRAIRSRLYDAIGDAPGRLLDLLGCFALFDDDPTRVNRIDAEFARVTPELLLLTARRYLRRENRTLLCLQARRNVRGRVP